MTSDASRAARLPLVDLERQHRDLAREIRDGIEDVVRRGAFILGEEVAAFEREFATFSQVRHCVGVASGTDALELALRAAGVGSGDEVLVPANTFFATALAVVRAGARPVFVDCDPDTQLIDVKRAATRIGPKTRALLPVHLYGQMAPIEDLRRLAADARLVLVEDAAQAHGATQNGVPAGTMGVAAAFSFYPGKNLGAWGDGGAVLTEDDAVARRVRALRQYGSEERYYHRELGTNSRLDTVQAVVLSAKLRHLARWNDERRRAARRYDELLGHIANVRLPVTARGNDHVFHLYVVRVPDRDRVLQSLRASGIEAAIHYPIPLHLQEAFRDLGHREGDFPVAEAAAREVLSLPLFPGIRENEQARVAREFARAIGSP
jgi:dTDP-4-amino-4,6-dideoxygalactose transaminase